jgi:hypothetical protein
MIWIGIDLLFINWPRFSLCKSNFDQGEEKSLKICPRKSDGVI